MSKKRLGKKEARAALEMLEEIGEKKRKEVLLNLSIDVNSQWVVCCEMYEGCTVDYGSHFGTASTPLKAVKKARKALGLEPKKRTDGDRFRWLWDYILHNDEVSPDNFIKLKKLLFRNADKPFMSLLNEKMDEQEKKRNDPS